MIHTFTTEEHRWLSNMALVEIKLKGRIFSSVEHAYQSEKFADEAWKDTCTLDTLDPKQIKKMSQSPTMSIRPDWDQVKLLVMEHTN